PDPGLDPRPEVAVDGAARREVPREHPPLAARLKQVEDRIHHPPQAGRPRPSASPCRGQQRRDQRPLPIRDVACISPARAHVVAPGGRRPRHPIPRRLLPETMVNQASSGHSTSITTFPDRLLKLQPAESGAGRRRLTPGGQSETSGNLPPETEWRA